MSTPVLKPTGQPGIVAARGHPAVANERAAWGPGTRALADVRPARINMLRLDGTDGRPGTRDHRICCKFVASTPSVVEADGAEKEKEEAEDRTGLGWG